MNNLCDDEDTCSISNLSSDIDLRLPISLVNLTLLNTQLTTLPQSISNLQQLKLVQVKDSQLIEILLPKPLPSIRDLEFTWTQITNLTRNMLQSYPNLQHLNLSHNQISVIEDYAFTSTPSIVSIDLGSNQLRKLSAPLSARPLLDLKVLRLDNNKLAELSEDLFDTLFMLRQLSLAGNYLKIISDRTLRPMYYLEVLSLQNNQLRSLSLENQKLQKLDLSGNYLTAENITGLAMCRLTELDLSKNPVQNLSVLKLGEMEYLETLVMNHMSLLSFNTFDGPTSLRILSLQYNDNPNVSETSFKQLTQLNLLQVDGNRLTKLDPTNLPISLTYIGLDDNDFSCLYLKNLLKQLRLQGVRLYLTSKSEKYKNKFSDKDLTHIQGVACFVDDRDEAIVKSCKIVEENFVYAWHTSIATSVFLVLAMVYVFLLWLYRHELKKVKDNAGSGAEEVQVLTFHDLLSKDQNE